MTKQTAFAMLFLVHLITACTSRDYSHLPRVEPIPGLSSLAASRLGLPSTGLDSIPILASDDPARDCEPGMSACYHSDRLIIIQAEHAEARNYYYCYLLAHELTHAALHANGKGMDSDHLLADYRDISETICEAIDQNK
jgi:hypothetical protein